MTTSNSPFFIVISPEGEIKACKKTGNVLTTFAPEHPHFHVINFNIKEYMECYEGDLHDRIHMRDLGFAKTEGDIIEVYGPDPHWRINRKALTEAAADPTVQIVVSEYGPEILCANATYSTQSDCYICTCQSCLSDSPATDNYYLSSAFEDLPYEHQWPQWGA